MRRGDGQTGAIGERFQQRSGEGCSLTRIGAGTHFIQQHQRWRSRCLKGGQNPPNALDMTTEGGQALLKGLLVTDIRQHLGAPGQGGWLRTGKKHSRTGHQGCKANAFERDCFATGVGTGDRHHP